MAKKSRPRPMLRLMKIDQDLLSGQEIRALEELAASMNHDPPELQEIWAAMDRVWDELGCDSKNLDAERLAAFYRHPVWLLNDLFIGRDAESMKHRRAIARWIAEHGSEIRSVLDYGGGFGRLACLIAEANPEVKVDVYEPYPSPYARARIMPYGSVRFRSAPASAYDCLTSLDVLEHLPDPIGTLADMIARVRLGGYLLIGNCFKPVIKCHLPRTFHLRFSFDLIARRLGLRKLGAVAGSHVSIYRRASATIASAVERRVLERASRALFPVLEVLHRLYSLSRRA